MRVNLVKFTRHNIRFLIPYRNKSNYKKDNLSFILKSTFTALECNQLKTEVR